MAASYHPRCSVAGVPVGAICGSEGEGCLEQHKLNLLKDLCRECLPGFAVLSGRQVAIRLESACCRSSCMGAENFEFRRLS